MRGRWFGVSIGFRQASVPAAAGLVALLSAGLSGCSSASGPGSGGGSTSPTAPAFTLSVTPTAPTVTVGATTSVTISLSIASGSSSPGTVTVQLSGLPLGVIALPTLLQVTSTTPVTVTLQTSSYTPAGSSAVTVTGTSGAASATAQFTLTVQPVSTRTASVGRTKYLRTDAVTEYGDAINSRWIVYHAATNRFFVSDPDSNQIMVLNAATQTEVGAITVPGAYGIDLTPDGTTLYAGTQIGDVYAIDPVGMAVTHRYLSSGIGPSGYAALSAFVLANGQLALLGSAGGIASVDGSGSFALWSPATNAFSVYTPSSICAPMQNIGAFTVSGDRTTVLLGSIDSDGTVCAFNATTKQAVTTHGGGEFIFHLVSTPDGTAVLQPNQQGAEIAVLNGKTLALERNIPVVSTSSATTIAVSPDSSTLYLNNGEALYAYSIATGAQTGWMPGLTVEPVSGGFDVGTTPVIQAMDGTGLLAGPTEEGVGFFDTTALQTGTVGSLVSNGYVLPATGPVSGGTPVTFDAGFPTAPVAVYFDSVPATSVTSKFTAVTPAHPAGKADVYAYMNDGGVLMLPEAFSFGPTVLEVTPNYATADGGGTGWVYGYGFGSTAYNGQATGLQVSVGGSPVTVQSFEDNAYGLASPPFPVQAFSYTIPAGIAATTAAMTVTTPSGTTATASAVQYLPALRQFPLAGASLAQGVYDAKRNLYYFSNANEIEVFSRSAGAWQTPIAVPAAPPGVAHRLWGIALSPDANLLAVSDPNTEAIYLLNLGTSSVQTFGVPKYGSGVLSLPAGLAVSDAGMVYFTQGDYGGTGYHGFYKLNTTTGGFLDYGVDNPGLGYSDLQLRAQITADNATVLFNEDGQILTVNTATDKLSYVKGGVQCCYGDDDIALSAGQTMFAATGYSFDTAFHEDSAEVLNDREVLNIGYVYGEKLSADGRLLFQPSTNGIDVFDGRLGTLRARVALPVALSEEFDALVADGTDNLLVGITGATGSGIALIDLTSLSEPAALPYVSVGETGPSQGQTRTASPDAATAEPASKGAATQRWHAVPHIVSGPVSSPQPK
jgi:hypothetical protein